MFTAACGGSSSGSSSSTAAPVATNAAMPAATAGTGGTSMMPLRKAAMIPASLQCTDAIVWVNLKTKSYHMAGDPMYGRTKSGAYLCQSAADAKGYHMAGTPKTHTGSHMSGGTMSGGAATPAPAAT